MRGPFPKFNVSEASVLTDEVNNTYLWLTQVT
jgi:hypothetical protein